MKLLKEKAIIVCDSTKEASQMLDANNSVHVVEDFLEELEKTMVSSLEELDTARFYQGMHKHLLNRVKYKVEATDINSVLLLSVTLLTRVGAAQVRDMLGYDPNGRITLRFYAGSDVEEVKFTTPEAVQMAYLRLKSSGLNLFYKFA